MQRKWAVWMECKTRHWTKRQQKTFMFLLCLVIGGFSTSSLLSFFRERNNAQINHLSSPSSLPLMPSIYPPAQPPDQNNLDTAVFSRFRKHLDSLRQTPSGRKTVDSFLLARPGFLDSLAFAEKSFQPLFPHL